MRVIYALVILLCVSTISYAADTVQIATTRDASGKFNNWVDQVVTWDTTVYQLANLADPTSSGTKALQTWYIPQPDGITAKKFTFSRSILGEYGIRWSADGTIWSDTGVFTILKPGHPRAGG